MEHTGLTHRVTKDVEERNFHIKINLRTLFSLQDIDIANN